MSGAEKIGIDEQIAAVGLSAGLAHASAEFRNDKEGKARGAALDAAKRTLEFVRDNREAFLAAVKAARAEAASKEKRPFCDLPPGQQAALRCQDPRFVRFLDAGDAATAAIKLRAFCGVASRADLEKSEPAAARWRELNLRFEAWLSGQGEEVEPARVDGLVQGNDGRAA